MEVFVISYDFRFCKNDSYVWEDDVLPLIAKQNNLMCFNHNDFWHPMDNLRDQRFLNEVWKKISALENLVKNIGELI